MFGKIASKLTILALRSSRLTLEEKAAVMNALIDNLCAIPVYAIIKVDEQGKLFVRGKAIELDQAIQLRESARVAITNIAVNLVDEHVDSMAVNIGVHQAQTTDQVVFSKAALWLSQEKRKLLKQMAGEGAP